MAVGRACQLRGALRLLDRTGVFIVEIRYFSVNSDGIRELRYPGANMQGEGLIITFDAVSDSARLGGAHTAQ